MSNDPDEWYSEECNDHIDNDPEFDNVDDDDDLGNCGMTPAGQCTLAGSEECDFECPLMFRMTQRKLRKKAKP